MASFWEAIAGTNVKWNWLIKVRSHLDKIEREQEKVKQGKLSSLLKIRALRKWFLSDSMSTSFIFNLNQAFSVW